MSSTQTSPQINPDPAQLGGAEPVRSAVTQEEFLHHMKAMSLHYKAGSSGRSGPTHPYALPIHLMHPVSEEGTLEAVQRPAGPGKAAVDKVLQTGQANYKAFTQKQHDFVQQQTNKLQGSHDTSSFANQMNAQRQKAKQESDQHIDDMFNKLIDVGTQHPDQQQQILSLTSKIGAFVTSLLVSVGQFLTSIVHKVLAWIQSAADWVKGAAAAAANWVAGAAKSVASFFGSIF